MRFRRKDPGWALRGMQTGVRLEDVIGAVADAFALEADDLQRDGRKPSIALPKHLAAYLARDLCGVSYPTIAAALDTDHASVIRSCRRAEGLVRSDPRVECIVKRLRGELLATTEAAE